MKNQEGTPASLFRSHWCIAILFMAVFTVLISVNPCGFFSLRLQDMLYQISGKPMKQLQIVPASMPYENNAHLREDLAKLIYILNADPNQRPAVIGVDVPLYGRSSQASDDALAQAVLTADNVILTSMLEFDYRLIHRYGRFYAEDMQVNGLYQAVPPMDTVPFGYANLVADRDGRVRHSLFAAKYEGNIVHAFPYEIYKMYMHGNDIGRTPPLNVDGLWFVDYRGKPHSFYKGITWDSVLEGTASPSLWKDDILLLTVDPKTQHLSPTPMGRQTPTEIAANMIQGLLQPHYKLEIPIWFQAPVILVLTWACSFVVRKGKWTAVACTVGLSVAWPMLCMLLYHLLHVVTDPFYLPLFVTILCIYSFVARFLQMGYRRTRTWLILRRYLPPVMRRRLFTEDVALEKAQKRNIAVLFVDIRGFTPLSESLSPSQLAQVLKEYLSLTSGAIFENGGTLDKFIGDATMGFFNAPLQQEDYVYYAVKAAMDIVAGGQKVREAVYKRFGRNIYFGVGVHCGSALVGRIGPDYRQDYTAVGDTVNTAARLESNAKSGEVLVSLRVCEQLRGRIKATFAGERQIKGKSRPMLLYRVEALYDTVQPPEEVAATATE